MFKKFLYNIPTLILLIVSIMNTYVVISLGVLTKKYLLILIAIEIILFLLGTILYNLKNNFIKIIGIIIIIIAIIGNVFAFYYVNKTNKYLEKNFSQESYKIKTKYYLIGRKDNSKKKEDITKDEKIYYYKYSQAIDKAKDKFKDNNLEETNSLYNSLISVASDNTYLLVSQADYDYQISAANDINKETYKIIYEFNVEEYFKINNKVSDTYNIYINGMDYSGSRRDFNMIVTVNTKTHKVVLTSIPRDYYVYVPAYDMKDTLTWLGSVDSEISKEALENLFDIKIDYTLNLYTESLVKVVDTLGGVEFCSDKEYYTTHDTTLGSYEDTGAKVHVKKGCHTYNGLEMLAISRERVKLGDGDRGRINNDRQIVVNIIKKLSNVDTLKNYNQILNSFDGLYTSNINKRVITDLIQNAIENPKFEIIEQSVDGLDTMALAGRGTFKAWALEPYMDTVNNASNKIKEVINEK